MANPVLERNFGGDAAADASLANAQQQVMGHEGPITSDRMEAGGVVGKTAFLLLLVVGAGAWGWQQVQPGEPFPAWYLWVLLGAVAVAIFTAVRPQLAPFLGPLYALLQGALVGTISRLYETLYDGIIVQAVLATVATFVVMLVLYVTGVIKATPRFRKTVIVATVGIFFFYLVAIVLSFFGLNMDVVWGGGPLGILISVAVIIVAALNLVLDFDFIDRGIEAGLPKQMEWLAAFGLMVTIVWLYLEFLRLFARLQQR